MRFIDNILYIEFQEAIKAGISSRTANRLNSLADPLDKRKALIEFESLKDIYKTLIVKEYGNPYEYANNQSIKSSPLFVLPTSDKNIINNYELGDGRALPDNYKERYYQECRYLNILSIISKQEIKGLGYPSTADFKKAMLSLIKTDDLAKLPTSRTRLDSTIKEYRAQGAIYLIQKNAHRFQNNNRTKIVNEIADWLLAQYCLPIKHSYAKLHTLYIRKKVAKEGLPMLTEQAIRYFLNKEEIKPIWTLARHGKQYYKKNHEHHLKLRKASFANAFWVIDGTKLDVYYQTRDTIDANGKEIKVKKKVARLKIDVVMDAHSEKIIGWNVSESETHIDHYKAFKMAVQEAQVKPWQVAYDGQSGHTSKMMQRFYDNLIAEGGTHFKSRPYGSQGKPIEQMFNRFQKQVLKEYWFCDGQSPLSKSEDSKVNPSFVSGEKDTSAFKERVKELFPNFEDRLPFKEDIIEVYVPKMVADWNNGKLKKSDKNRIELYTDSEDPKEQPIDFLDMVNLFWLTTGRPITYYKGGLTLSLGKQEYQYEVYDADNNVDLRFRKRNVGVKFFVQYDPDDLTEVRLLEKTHNEDFQFIASASEKRTHTQVVIDMKDGDKEAWSKDFKVRDTEFGEILDEIARIRKVTGITPESLIEDAEQVLKDGGYADKEKRNDAESSASFLNQL